MLTLSAGTKQRIDADGFAVIAGVLGYREMDTLKADMHKMPLHRSRAGARHMLGNASVAALASDPKLLEIARQILGYEARPFRATLFDKSPSSNWLVVWHQDTTRNLKYMRAFAEAYPDQQFVQQVVAQLPWGHNVRILEMVKAPAEREWYIRQAVESGWTRNVLVHQIEGDLHRRQGRALTNFQRTLPAPQSELAQELQKGQYCG
jgi:predicted nuclease of restriction endonuclease-like (RecB) superfamily